MYCGKGKLCHLALTLVYGGQLGVIRNILMPWGGGREENVFNKKNSPGSLVTL